MTHESWRRLLIRIRDALSVLALILLLLSEAYTAVAIVLDRNEFTSEPWEHTLGWLLFLIPCALVLGLVFLLNAGRRELGFRLAAMSLLLYAALVCFDAYREPMDDGDWISVTIWLAFCAIGIVAAKLLMRRRAP
jgi:cytochrome bd-type quinol oxidase subunit 2